MQGYYEITTKIKEYLDAHESINTVKLGDVNYVDIQKQTIFPLAQLIVGDAEFVNSTIQFDIRVLVMDLVYYSNDNPEDQIDYFNGIDNKQDVYNTTLAVVNGLQQSLKCGELFQSQFHISSDIIATPFEDDYGNLLTGWGLDFTIMITNTNVGDGDFFVPQVCKITFDNTLITFDNTQ